MVTLDQGGAGRAFTEIHLPPPQIRDRSEHLFVIHDAAEGPSMQGWRIVPDMSPHLLAHFTKDSVRVRVVGGRTEFIDRPQGTRRFTVGARLLPGTLPLLSGLPADDFTDRSVAVEEVWGRKGATLTERLGEAAAPTAARALIGDFLSNVMNSTLRVDWRIRRLGSAATECRGGKPIGELAKEMGVGARTLRQVAQDKVGLSPKHFARIHRLFAALELGLDGSPRWSRVAAASGYADQPHMIREFQDLLGESPEAYRNRRRV